MSIKMINVTAHHTVSFICACFCNLLGFKGSSSFLLKWTELQLVDAVSCFVMFFFSFTVTAFESGLSGENIVTLGYLLPYITNIMIGSITVLRLRGQGQESVL
uniref:Uncharacterized protein n=1 Tax=Cacopsylla melanoneura TaxID=428564 RepID=A0A8D9BCM4_9HEMI